VTTPRHNGSETVELSPREREILRALIRAHVLTGEPVGSRTLAGGGPSLGSAATIRSGMSSLEAKGLLAKPHTSAGRVPTDAAYRLFVDRLMDRPRMGVGDARAIESALRAVRGEFEDLLAEASRQLSRHSAQVGVVVAPELRRIVVDRLELVRVSGARGLAVLVGRSGSVHHRMLDDVGGVDQEELDRISRFLNDEVAGRTLPQMRAELVRRMGEERSRIDSLVARGLDLGRRAVAIEDGDREVFVEGTTNLLSHPEFADVDRMRSLLSALEEKTRLVRWLGRVLESQGVQVLIGSEATDARLDGVSLVASSYRAGERVLGTVGIVGPVRMPYGRAVALVDHLSRSLTHLLTEGDAENRTR
jgi:heat-inducible transcriptional repressor